MNCVTAWYKIYTNAAFPLSPNVRVSINPAPFVSFFFFTITWSYEISIVIVITTAIHQASVLNGHERSFPNHAVRYSIAGTGLLYESASIAQCFSRFRIREPTYPSSFLLHLCYVQLQNGNGQNIVTRLSILVCTDLRMASRRLLQQDFYRPIIWKQLQQKLTCTRLRLIVSELVAGSVNRVGTFSLCLTLNMAMHRCLWRSMFLPADRLPCRMLIPESSS